MQLSVRVTEAEAQMLDERMRQLRAGLPDALGRARIRLGRQQGLRAALLTWLGQPIEGRS